MPKRPVHFGTGFLWAVRVSGIAKQGTCDGGLSPGAIAVVRYAEASSE
jgi:hypothetical protein